MSMTVEALAKQLDRLDALFPGIEWETKALARALLPLIERHIAAGQQGADQVVIEGHWLENIAAAAALLSGDDSLISRREGEALYTLVKSARRHAAPQTMTTQGEAVACDVRLGQIGYEAAARVTGCDQTWEHANKPKWIAAASAIAARLIGPQP